jgi:hypothetical protein
MIKVLKKLLLLILIVLTFTVPVYSQSIDTSISVSFKERMDFAGSSELYKPESLPSPVFKDQNSTLPLALGLVIFLYLLNPILVFDDGATVGLTKELSLGFGALGEYRLGAEYTFLFRENNKSQLRFSANYDYLTSDLEPSNMLQTSGVLSIGGGYFTDFDSHGFFPQIAYGFSIRNDKLLFFPHVKARYTFVNGAERNNLIDFSFGIILGFANPFIDLKIRKEY